MMVVDQAEVIRTRIVGRRLLLERQMEELRWRLLVLLLWETL